MNHFNIDWNEAVRFTFVLYADVLGYYVEIESVASQTPDHPNRFKASYEVADVMWAIPGPIDYATADEAKLAVDTWLAKEVRRQRARFVDQVPPEPVFQLDSGLSFGLRFLDALAPHMAETDLVEVLPAVGEKGSKGLYLRCDETGNGLKILSDARPGFVTMLTGRLTDLDAESSGPSIGTVHFHEAEIKTAAAGAAALYLRRDLAVRKHKES